jgi:polyhydroxybutyrate depolymerase
LHGTADGTLAYTGGEGAGSISDVVSYWAEKNGANSIPAISNLTSGSSTIVEKSVYSDSNGTAWVEHYKVVGGQHVWLDLDLNGSDTNELIWDFFSKHTLSGPLSTP